MPSDHPCATVPILSVCRAVFAGLLVITGLGRTSGLEGTQGSGRLGHPQGEQGITTLHLGSLGTAAFRNLGGSRAGDR